MLEPLIPVLWGTLVGTAGSQSSYVQTFEETSNCDYNLLCFYQQHRRGSLPHMVAPAVFHFLLVIMITIIYNILGAMNASPAFFGLAFSTILTIKCTDTLVDITLVLINSAYEY